MNRIEVNVITGEQTVIPLTAEEIAELQSRPVLPPPPPLTPVEKLAAAGLTVAELRELLAPDKEFTAAPTAGHLDDTYTLGSE
jgi:hypothetical protein